jgi:hypothetical protein
MILFLGFLFALVRLLSALILLLEMCRKFVLLFFFRFGYFLLLVLSLLLVPAFLSWLLSRFSIDIFPISVSPPILWVAVLVIPPVLIRSAFRSPSVLWLSVFLILLPILFSPIYSSALLPVSLGAVSNSARSSFIAVCASVMYGRILFFRNYLATTLYPSGVRSMSLILLCLVSASSPALSYSG